MEDQTRSYLIEMAVKALGISRKAAELRINAFLKSGLIDKYKVTPDDMLFQVITDIAMQIPQIGIE